MKALEWDDLVWGVWRLHIFCIRNASCMHANCTNSKWFSIVSIELVFFFDGLSFVSALFDAHGSEQKTKCFNWNRNIAAAARSGNCFSCIGWNFLFFFSRIDRVKRHRKKLSRTSALPKTKRKISNKGVHQIRWWVPFAEPVQCASHTLEFNDQFRLSEKEERHLIRFISTSDWCPSTKYMMIKGIRLIQCECASRTGSNKFNFVVCGLVSSRTFYSHFSLLSAHGQQDASLINRYLFGTFAFQM